MSRIRSIKPEILEDERTARLSHGAYRLFMGCISLADDYGNLRGSLDFLHGRIFHSSPLPELPAALQELVSAGLVRPYLVRAQAFLSITNWAKHQKIVRPARPHIPGPADADASAPLDARWTWPSAPPPAPSPSPEPQEQQPHDQPEEEVAQSVRDRQDLSPEGLGAASAGADGGAGDHGEELPVLQGGDSGRPAAAPELPAAPEPLTGLEALRILAEAAGSRLSMHPAGHPNPTVTGATKRAEEQFAQAWEPLASTWGAEHLRALGKGIGARELWRHLRGGVSLKYLIDHLEEGLQQAAVAPAREPVAPPPAAPARAARPAQRPRPEPVKGEFRESLRALEGVVSPALMESLRVVRDDDYAQAEAG